MSTPPEHRHDPILARPPHRIIGETVTNCAGCPAPLRWSARVGGWVVDDETPREVRRGE